METHTADYVNAGHLSPYLFHEGEMFRLEKGTTVLGAFRQLPFLEVGTLKGLKSCFFFACTDGLTEAFDDRQVEFGENELDRLILDNVNVDPKELHLKIIAEVDRFRGRNDFTDDLTLLSLRLSQ